MLTARAGCFHPFCHSKANECFHRLCLLQCVNFMQSSAYLPYSPVTDWMCLQKYGIFPGSTRLIPKYVCMKKLGLGHLVRSRSGATQGLPVALGHAVAVEALRGHRSEALPLSMGTLGRGLPTDKLLAKRFPLFADKIIGRFAKALQQEGVQSTMIYTARQSSKVNNFSVSFLYRHHLCIRCPPHDC